MTRSYLLEIKVVAFRKMQYILSFKEFFFIRNQSCSFQKYTISPLNRNIQQTYRITGNFCGFGLKRRHLITKSRLLIPFSAIIAVALALTQQVVCSCFDIEQVVCSCFGTEQIICFCFDKDQVVFSCFDIEQVVCSCFDTASCLLLLWHRASVCSCFDTASCLILPWQSSSCLLLLWHRASCLQVQPIKIYSISI